MRTVPALVAAVSGLVVVLALGSRAPAAQSPPAKVDFVTDIQPLFRQHCIGCHGPSQQMNGLRLDRRRDAMRGGTFPVIGPGNGEASQLYLRVAGTRPGISQMPPTGALKPEQVALIKAWIDQGAEWPDAAANDVELPPPDPAATRLNDTLRRGDRAAFTATLSSTPAAANARGPAGVTPLMSATLYATVAEMGALIASGADVNARNDAGATALTWAVTDLEKTRLLLDRGADVDVKTLDSRTPLMIAAGLRGSIDVVKLLLARGANPSASGPGLLGTTNPLTESAFAGDAATFRALVEGGADLKSALPGALAMAGYSQCDACLDVLMKVAPPPPLLSMAAGILAPPLGDARLSRPFIERGADVNARDPEGRPLIVAVASSDVSPVETMQALIQRGADVNARGPQGETALDAARQRGQTPMVELLMKAGAASGTGSVAAAPAFKAASSPRDAIARSMPLLQRTDATFLRKSGCVSCHNNTLTAMTVATLRQRGLPVDATAARQSVSKIAAFIEAWRERALQNIGIPGDSDTVSYILLGLAAENHPADVATDAHAQFLLSKQLPDGHWSILAHRPPIESSDIEVTAASMHALQLYAPRSARATFDRAIERAGTWLKAARAETNEDRVFKVLGLTWVRADRAAVDAAARALIAAQRPDGGWSQIPTLESDAYATGQALVALAESGALPPNNATYQRGVQFLLKTQTAEGVWFVRTRAIAIQPLFDPDFPYGRNSFISAAATNWATRALAYAAGRTN